MGLFLFFSAGKVLASLLTAYFVALRPPFPIRRAQCVRVFLLSSPSFGDLFAGLGSTNKMPLLFPSPSLRFLLCFCYIFLFFILFSSSNSLAHLGGTILFLLSFYYQATVGPGTRFSQKMTLPVSWPGGLRLSTEELMLLHHARCIPSCFSCNGHSLL